MPGFQPWRLGDERVGPNGLAELEQPYMWSWRASITAYHSGSAHCKQWKAGQDLGMRLGHKRVGPNGLAELEQPYMWSWRASITAYHSGSAHCKQWKAGQDLGMRLGHKRVGPNGLAELEQPYMWSWRVSIVRICIYRGGSTHCKQGRAGPLDASVWGLTDLQGCLCTLLIWFAGALTTLTSNTLIAIILITLYSHTNHTQRLLQHIWLHVFV